MIKLNYKNFQESFLEKVENYLENNPCTDYRDDVIETSDLYLDEGGNVVYLYSWKTTSYRDEDSHQTIDEVSNEKYAILITREQIKTL